MAHPESPYVRTLWRRYLRIREENAALYRLLNEYRQALNAKYPPVCDAVMVLQTKAQEADRMKVTH